MKKRDDLRHVIELQNEAALSVIKFLPHPFLSTVKKELGYPKNHKPISSHLRNAHSEYDSQREIINYTSIVLPYAIFENMEYLYIFVFFHQYKYIHVLNLLQL